MSVNLNHCKDGDGLICRNGKVLIYVRKNTYTNTYNHIVKYPNCGLFDTRTDNGFVVSSREDGFDVISVLNNDFMEGWEDI